MDDETTKIFLNSKGKREGIDSDLAAFLDYIEGKTPKGKFTEIRGKREGIYASCMLWIQCLQIYEIGRAHV